MRSDEATLIAEWKRECGQGGRSSFQRLSGLACRWNNSRVKLKLTLCSWAPQWNRWSRLLREASWAGEEKAWVDGKDARFPQTNTCLAVGGSDGRAGSSWKRGPVSVAVPGGGQASRATDTRVGKNRTCPDGGSVCSPRLFTGDRVMMDASRAGLNGYRSQRVK